MYQYMVYPVIEVKKKTRVINNNGFDPTWNETFQAQIRFPQLALIYFNVLDYDQMSKDDRIAFFLCTSINDTNRLSSYLFTS